MVATNYRAPYRTLDLDAAAAAAFTLADAAAALGAPKVSKRGVTEFVRGDCPVRPSGKVNDDRVEIRYDKYGRKDAYGSPLLYATCYECGAASNEILAALKLPNPRRWYSDTDTLPPIYTPPPSPYPGNVRRENAPAYAVAAQGQGQGQGQGHGLTTARPVSPLLPLDRRVGLTGPAIVVRSSDTSDSKLDLDLATEGAARAARRRAQLDLDEQAAVAGQGQGLGVSCAPAYLPPVTASEGAEYLARIATPVARDWRKSRRLDCLCCPDYAACIYPPSAGEIAYSNADGRVAYHKRWLDLDGNKERRNPGLTEAGWDGRLWAPDPEAFARALLADGGVVILVTEGEKDAALAQATGRWAYSTPGGAGRILSPGAILFDALLDKVKEFRAAGYHVSVMLGQDNDDRGYEWGDAVSRIVRGLGLPCYRPNPCAQPVKSSLADSPTLLADAALGAIARVSGRLDLAPDTAPRGPADFDTDMQPDPVKGGREVIPRLRRRDMGLPCLRLFARESQSMEQPKFDGKPVDVKVDKRRPIECGQCANCLRFSALEKAHKWGAARPVAGQVTTLEFSGLTWQAVDVVLKKQWECTNCLLPAAYILQRLVALDVDADGVIGSTEYLYRVLIFYLHRLPRAGVLAIGKWRKAVNSDLDAGMRIDAPKVTHNRTVTAEDFADLLPEKTLPWHGDRASRRTCGFWRWEYRYPNSRELPPTYADGKVARFDATPGAGDGLDLAPELWLSDAEYARIPATAGAAEIDAALLDAVETSRAYDYENPYRAATERARRWLLRCTATEADYAKADADDRLGRGPLYLPGYYGPQRLLKEAIRARRGEKFTTPLMVGAYAEVWGKIERNSRGSRDSGLDLDGAVAGQGHGQGQGLANGATLSKPAGVANGAPSRLQRKLRGALKQPAPAAPSDTSATPVKLDLDVAAAAAAGQGLGVAGQGLTGPDVYQGQGLGVAGQAAPPPSVAPTPSPTPSPSRSSLDLDRDSDWLDWAAASNDVALPDYTDTEEYTGSDYTDYTLAPATGGGQGHGLDLDDDAAWRDWVASIDDVALPD